VIADMNSPSEALVINPQFNWQYFPVITQYSPAGSSIPSWWTGNRPDWCHTALSWFTAYEAQGNAATNTRVQLKNLRMYFLSQKTRQWTRVDYSPAPRVGLWQYPVVGAGTNTGERLEPTGGKSIKPAYPYFFHGYGNPYVIPDPADVRATFMAMDFRLVIDDTSKPDDRAAAKYVVDAAGDYYPGYDTAMTWTLGYAPGMGNGRYLQATPNWRTATLIVPNKDYGATLSEMQSNPPPMN
jgi:hypothetical protein